MTRFNGSFRGRGLTVFGLCLSTSLACSEQTDNIAADSGAVTTEAGVTAPAPTSPPTPEQQSDSGPLFAEPPTVEVPEVPEVPDAGPPPPPRLTTCTPYGGANAEKLVDDLEDGDEALPGEDGGWFEVKDPAPGTFEVGVEQIPGGRGASQYAMHAKGSGNSEWGASFGVYWNACVFDGSSFRGVRFWARGNGSPVRYLSPVPGVVPVSEGGGCALEAEGLCWDAHTTSLAFDAEWKEYFVPFDSLAQTGWGLKVSEYDPKLIFTLQFQTDANYDFDYWIDDIGFYTDEDRALAEAAQDAGPGDAAVSTGADASTSPEAGAPAGAVDAGPNNDASAPDVDAAEPAPSETDAATEPNDAGRADAAGDAGR
jgi:hypothetical protein